MCTEEVLENGKVALNIFSNYGWSKHIFSDTETLDKFYNKMKWRDLINESRY